MLQAPISAAVKSVTTITPIAEAKRWRGAALAPEAFTFMGGIYSARKVRDLLAPAIAERLVADQVDLVLLVPV